MILENKKRAEITTDLLLKFADDHASKININTIETYKEDLYRIFTTHKNGNPINIILPGFPCKSANTTHKVLGKLPDLGEKIALKKLERLRETLSKKLNLSVNLIICSDGFAFNDLKNIPDEDVLAYRSALKLMIKKYKNIKIKSLDDFMPNISRENRRKKLMDEYGTDSNKLYEEIKENCSLNTFYNNLSIFAKKDLIKYNHESKKAFKARCKETAFNVLARSNAWAGLIADRYPNAIRLTIHPYTDVSEKFSICLLPSIDKRWRTPWHNVPVITSSSPSFSDCVELTPKKEIDNSKMLLTHKGGRA